MCCTICKDVSLRLVGGYESRYEDHMTYVCPKCGDVTIRRYYNK